MKLLSKFTSSGIFKKPQGSTKPLAKGALPAELWLVIFQLAIDDVPSHRHSPVLLKLKLVCRTWYHIIEHEWGGTVSVYGAGEADRLVKMYQRRGSLLNNTLLKKKGRKNVDHLQIFAVWNHHHDLMEGCNPVKLYGELVHHIGPELKSLTIASVEAYVGGLAIDSVLRQAKGGNLEELKLSQYCMMSKDRPDLTQSCQRLRKVTFDLWTWDDESMDMLLALLKVTQAPELEIDVGNRLVEQAAFESLVPKLVSSGKLDKVTKFAMRLASRPWTRCGPVAVSKVKGMHELLLALASVRELSVTSWDTPSYVNSTADSKELGTVYPTLLKLPGTLEHLQLTLDDRGRADLKRLGSYIVAAKLNTLKLAVWLSEWDEVDRTTLRREAESVGTQLRFEEIQFT
ncbi:hypothetical protein T439DRAFT_324140 [Meredithblackwellia eburnea MCA 4105]